MFVICTSFDFDIDISFNATESYCVKFSKHVNVDVNENNVVLQSSLLKWFDKVNYHLVSSKTTNFAKLGIDKLVCHANESNIILRQCKLWSI